MLYRFLQIIFKPIFSILYNIKVYGEFQYEEGEHLIICSNHGSKLDPIFLGISIRPPISFMAKKELFKNKIFGKVLEILNVFPVDREGKDVKTLMQTVKRIKSGEIVGIFIEGTRVKSFDKKNAKQGAIAIAGLSKAKIVPIYIKSDYKIFGKTEIIIRNEVEIPKPNRDEKALFYQKEAEKLLEYIYMGDEN